MLTTLLENEAVPFETLHERYGSLLRLVRKLIGVVPNCDRYLEIWPTAFRTYNVMVPNFLNLPFSLWGMGPRKTMGLAMYVASRVAGCPYCSAHCCSFALRRGATVDEVAMAVSNPEQLTSGDRAALSAARALASVPATFTAADREALWQHFSPEKAEWIALSIAMIGWMNKAMDALGVPLELSTVEEVNSVIAPSGWTPGQLHKGAPPTGAPPRADTVMSNLAVIRLAPSAIALDRKWTAGVPDRWPQVGEFLRKATGHDFPALAKLHHRRAIRAIATMIRDNFADEGSVIGREKKLGTGLIFAEVIQNPQLAEELRAAGAKPIDDSALARLARAISPSPATVDATIVDTSRALSASAIVELVSFISVLQMWHRLTSYVTSA
jgi:alkylhydroperoxidase family enzyme